MRRTIVEPADVSGAALAELKTWLGISRSNEDELLANLLLASLDMCEAFIGQAPLLLLVEERLPGDAGRYALTTQPVTGLVASDILANDGSITALDPNQFELQIEASGKGVLNLYRDTGGTAVILQFRAGIAADWDTIPAALQQGIIRLAAFHYRDRDRPGGSEGTAQPPASITALWRPWRKVRLQ